MSCLNLLWNTETPLEGVKTIDFLENLSLSLTFIFHKNSYGPVIQLISGSDENPSMAERHNKYFLDNMCQNCTMGAIFSTSRVGRYGWAGGPF